MNYIGFTDEELDKIVEFKEQEEFETIQEAIMYAIENLRIMIKWSNI